MRPVTLNGLNCLKHNAFNKTHNYSFADRIYH